MSSTILLILPISSSHSRLVIIDFCGRLGLVIEGLNLFSLKTTTYNIILPPAFVSPLCPTHLHIPHLMTIATAINEL